MKVPFLSVVCTLFNRESSIEKTLNSVLPYLSDDDEFILVDDGSTDQGGRIVKKAFEGRKNCHYFYQENKGLTIAFNRCLDCARGEYIVNIDSDDYFTESGLKIIRDTLRERNPDMLHYGWLEIGPDGLVTEHPNFPEECHFNSRKAMLASKVFQSRAGSVINGYVRKAIRRSVIGDMRLEPPDKGGDNPLIAKIFLKCNSFSAIRDLCYVYVVTPNSVSRTKTNSEYSKTALSRWIRTVPYFVNNGKEEEFPLVEAIKIFYAYRDYCFASISEKTFDRPFARKAAKLILKNRKMIMQKRHFKGAVIDNLYLRAPRIAVILVNMFYKGQTNANSAGKYAF